jgi:hypothetical protein
MLILLLFSFMSFVLLLVGKQIEQMVDELPLVILKLEKFNQTLQVDSIVKTYLYKYLKNFHAKRKSKKNYVDIRYRYRQGCGSGSALRIRIRIQGQEN